MSTTAAIVIASCVFVGSLVVTFSVIFWCQWIDSGPSRKDRKRWADAQWELDNLTALSEQDRAWLKEHTAGCRFNVEHWIRDCETELLMETWRH